MVIRSLPSPICSNYSKISSPPKSDRLLVRDLGRKIIKKVLAAIDQTVEGFLNQALQISPEQVAVQLKAEELGYL
jgi:hypothetical protein